MEGALFLRDRMAINRLTSKDDAGRLVFVQPHLILNFLKHSIPTSYIFSVRGAQAMFTRRPDSSSRAAISAAEFPTAVGMPLAPDFGTAAYQNEKVHQQLYSFHL